jgi:hypothetical protein
MSAAASAGALPANAVAEARPERLTILADPNAAGFYERNGAGADRRGALGRGARPSAADIRFYVAVKSRPAAGFPDQAKKFPDGPN